MVGAEPRGGRCCRDSIDSVYSSKVWLDLLSVWRRETDHFCLVQYWQVQDPLKEGKLGWVRLGFLTLLWDISPLCTGAQELTQRNLVPHGWWSHCYSTLSRVAGASRAWWVGMAMWNPGNLSRSSLCSQGWGCSGHGTFLMASGWVLSQFPQETLGSHWRCWKVEIEEFPHPHQRR